MSPEQEARTAALAAAVALATSAPTQARIPNVIETADRLTVWLLTGELPQLPPGRME